MTTKEEVVQPLKAKLWEDRHAWAEEVVGMAESNELSIPGIRDFKARMRDRKLDIDATQWLQAAVNKALSGSGLALDYKYGLVIDNEN